MYRSPLYDWEYPPEGGPERARFWRQRWADDTVLTNCLDPSRPARDMVAAREGMDHYKANCEALAMTFGALIGPHARRAFDAAFEEAQRAAL